MEASKPNWANSWVNSFRLEGIDINTTMSFKANWHNYNLYYIVKINYFSFSIFSRFLIDFVTSNTKKETGNKCIIFQIIIIIRNNDNNKSVSAELFHVWKQCDYQSFYNNNNFRDFEENTHFFFIRFKTRIQNSNKDTHWNWSNNEYW